MPSVSTRYCVPVSVLPMQWPMQRRGRICESVYWRAITEDVFEVPLFRAADLSLEPGPAQGMPVAVVQSLQQPPADASAAAAFTLSVLQQQKDRSACENKHSKYCPEVEKGVAGPSRLHKWNPSPSPVPHGARGRSASGTCSGTARAGLTAEWGAPPRSSARVVRWFRAGTLAGSVGSRSEKLRMSPEPNNRQSCS